MEALVITGMPQEKPDLRGVISGDVLSNTV